MNRRLTYIDDSFNSRDELSTTEELPTSNDNETDFDDAATSFDESATPCDQTFEQMLKNAEFLADHLQKAKNKAKIEILKYALEEFEIYKHEDAKNLRADRAHQLLCAIKLFNSLYKKHLKHSVLEHPGHELFNFIKDYGKQAKELKRNIGRHFHMIAETQADLEEDYLENHTHLADWLSEDLDRKKDVAKLDMLSYALEQFVEHFAEDQSKQNVERAWQVVHAYTLYHSLFKKQLRNTDLHNLGKRLDENAKIFDTLAQEFIKQAEEINQLQDKLTDRHNRDTLQMCTNISIAELTTIARKIRLRLAADHLKKMHQECNQPEENLSDTELLLSLDWSEDQSVDFDDLEWRENPLAQGYEELTSDESSYDFFSEPESPPNSCSSPSTVGLFSPRTRRLSSSSEESKFENMLMQFDTDVRNVI